MLSVYKREQAEGQLWIWAWSWECVADVHFFKSIALRTHATQAFAHSDMLLEASQSIIPLIPSTQSLTSSHHGLNHKTTSNPSHCSCDPTVPSTRCTHPWSNLRCTSHQQQQRRKWGARSTAIFQRSPTSATATSTAAAATAPASDPATAVTA